VARNRKLRATQGFKPTFWIRTQRILARILISLLRLHGRSRWSNEFIQALDPALEVEVPGFGQSGAKIWFRTGHGRLFWRATETPHEELETNQWIASFQSNDVFWDVGANIGLYSIAAAKFRGVSVVAIEPDLMNARMLYENVLRNGVSDYVTILPVAVASQSRVDRLYLKTLSYGDALHNLGSPSDYVTAPSGYQAQVAVLSLADLTRILGLPAPSRLKIDVDGIEHNVLLGLGDTLSSIKEVLIEVDLDKTTCERISSMMTEAGFRLLSESRPFVLWNTTVNRLYANREIVG
jgi:FkbM family methyltransferase